MANKSEDIEKGWELIRQKQFDEAERYFEQLLELNPNTPEPIRGLVHVARAKQDFSTMSERLDWLLELNPGLLYERIIRGLVQARHGAIEPLRAEIDSYFDMAEKQSMTVASGVQLLRAIQYAATGSQRTQQLHRLLVLVEKIIKAHPPKVTGYQILLAEIQLSLGNYNVYNQIVTELQNQNPNHKKIHQLARIAEKCSAPEFPDFSAPKVFGIGLSRTATSSLSDALQVLGLHAIHWTNPHSRALISQDDMLLFDAFSDISVSYQFELLYHTFPNAQFIYTTRTAKSWEKSILLHYKNSRGINLPSQLQAPSATQRFNFVAGHVEMNLYGRYETWKEAFDAYDERVRNFFRDKPSSRLLELNICDGEGWDKLCSFLDCPVPSTPFPNTNHSPAHISNKAGTS